MPVIESRYAEAFLGTIATPESADGIEKILSDFSELWKSSEEFKFFMLNPVVTDGAKKETVLQILAEDAGGNKMLTNFFNLLIDRERFFLLPEISREYTDIKNKLRNSINIEIYSAEPLEEHQMEALKEKYRRQYGAQHAAAKNLVDSSLIGGVRVKIGDMLIDDTLSGRLQNLLLAIE